MFKKEFRQYCQKNGIQSATVRDDSPRGCRTIAADDVLAGDFVLIDNHWTEIIHDEKVLFEKISDARDRVTFYNNRGEKIVADFSCNEDRQGRAALLNIWTRAGYITKDCVGVWNVDVQAVLPDGDCHGWYNPTIKLHDSGTRCQLVFYRIGYRSDAEKAEKKADILCEIFRLANANEGDYTNLLRGATK